jgi:hypothetical protein
MSLHGVFRGNPGSHRQVVAERAQWSLPAVPEDFLKPVHPIAKANPREQKS